MTDHVLNARHQIASAAGALASAAADVARALAWRPDQSHLAVTRSDLGAAIGNAQRAVDALKDASTRLSIAAEEAD